jgi:hypothetical protein
LIGILVNFFLRLLVFLEMPFPDIIIDSSKHSFGAVLLEGAHIVMGILLFILIFDSFYDKVLWLLTCLLPCEEVIEFQLCP